MISLTVETTLPLRLNGMEFNEEIESKVCIIENDSVLTGFEIQQITAIDLDDNEKVYSKDHSHSIADLAVWQALCEAVNRSDHVIDDFRSAYAEAYPEKRYYLHGAAA